MSPEGVRNYIKATPFKPFTVRLVSGKEIPVPHPDFVLQTPGGRRVFIATGRDTVEMLDVFMIESISSAGDSYEDAA